MAENVKARSLLDLLVDLGAALLAGLLLVVRALLRLGQVDVYEAGHAGGAPLLSSTAETDARGGRSESDVSPQRGA